MSRKFSFKEVYANNDSIKKAYVDKVYYVYVYYGSQ